MVVLPELKLEFVHAKYERPHGQSQVRQDFQETVQVLRTIRKQSCELLKEVVDVDYVNEHPDELISNPKPEILGDDSDVETE